MMMNQIHHRSLSSKLLLLIVLFVSVSLNNAGLPWDQALALKSISDSLKLGFSTYDCGSVGYKRNAVTCNLAMNSVETLTIEASDSKSMPYGDTLNFGLFPTLTTLTFYNTYPNQIHKSIISHPKIIALIYRYDAVGMSSQRQATMYTSVPSDRIDWTGMTNLRILHIDGLTGNIPTVQSNMAYYYIIAPAWAQKTITSPVIQTNIFTPSLLTFGLGAYNTLITSPPALDFNIFANAPNLNFFTLSSLNYPVTFEYFKKAQQLQVLELFQVTLDNTTMPSYDETMWQNLIYLSLRGLNLQGKFDTRFMFLPNLATLSIPENPLLSYQIPPNMNESKIITYYSFNTNLTGIIPENILDNGMITFSFANTKLSGPYPSILMCLPANLLPKYDTSGNVFSNYNGDPNSRVCQPTVTSIQPYPIQANNSITIYGRDLGSISQTTSITMTNTMGETYSLYCDLFEPNTHIECVNPFIQGTGNITIRVNNGNSVTPTTNIPYTYQNPMITKITPCPTLGGFITISGYDLIDRLNVKGKGVSIDINGIPCTKISVISPYNSLACYYPAGVTSNIPVSIQVKGLYNVMDGSVNFFYQSPIVVSSHAAKPNIASQLTITGSDFWNDTTIISVDIVAPNSDAALPPISCPVSYVNHNILVCDFPATPYQPGRKNIRVRVAGLESQKNALFEFIDDQICPNSCSDNGICDVAIGFCVCSNPTTTNNTLFGASCQKASSPLSMTNITESEPLLQLLPSFNDRTTLRARLISFIENGAETFVPSWVYAFNNDTSSHTYQWTSGAKTLTITIQPQTNGSVMLGGSYLTYPSNTYTYSVNYTLDGEVSDDTLQFKFAIDISPDECTTPPIIMASPRTEDNTTFHQSSDWDSTSSSGSEDNLDYLTSVRWSNFTVYDVEWFTRHPGIAIVNKGAGTIVTSIVEQHTDVEPNHQLLFINIKPPLGQSKISSAVFQYDFAVFEADTPRSPNIDNCTETPKWKIPVAVVVSVVGAALLAAGGYFLVKRQLKINNTRKLLNDRLATLLSNSQQLS